jgi:HEAT repeats
MYSGFSQLFSQFALKYISSVLLLGFTTLTFAATSENKALTTDLVISNDKGSELQLEVKQMPLAQVLDAIAIKTHIPIHYSALPEGFVNATCIGTTLKRVLECLLDRKADIIVRYPHKISNTAGKEPVAEAWILGSKLDGITAQADCQITGNLADKISPGVQQSQQDNELETDRTDELLKMAQSKNPEDRADAIAALLATSNEGDPNVNSTLEQALDDTDANVRAQAISSLSHREGSAASQALQEALHDESVDVRLMAVDGITDDAALLQQAANDSDETVRSLAAVKLAELNQTNVVNK